MLYNTTKNNTYTSPYIEFATSLTCVCNSSSNSNSGSNSRRNSSSSISSIRGSSSSNSSTVAVVAIAILAVAIAIAIAGAVATARTLQPKLLQERQEPQAVRSTEGSRCQALLARGYPETAHTLPTDLPNCFGIPLCVIAIRFLGHDKVLAKRLDENTIRII